MRGGADLMSRGRVDSIILQVHEMYNDESG